MLKKCLIGFTAVAALALSAQSASAQTVIRHSSWLPPSLFLWKDILVPWMAEVEKATQGRVKFEVAPKVVGSAANQIDVIADGLADSSFVNASYTPGRFASVEMAELPLGGEDAAVMSPAFDRMYRKHLEKLGEFRGVHLLSIFSITPLQPHTKDGKPIRTIEDFKGLKLRSPNPNTTMVMELVGAVPIHKSSTEAFEMLASGLIDGQVTIPNTIPGFNQLGLLKHVTLIPGGLANSVNMVAINEGVWKKISAADQKAIMAVSGEKLAHSVGAGYVKADEEALDLMRKAGYQVNKVDAAFVAKLTALLKPVEGAWIKRATEKGVPNPADLLAKFRAEIAAGTKKS